MSRARHRRWSVGAAVAVVASAAMLAWGTDGFRALTVDGARAARVAAAPRPLPIVRAIDADAAPVELGSGGVVTIVDFVSTSCTDACVAQGARFGAVQEALRHRPPSTPPVRLLTLSFDPDDDARRLERWASSHGADPARWRVAALTPRDRRAVLRAFGITVVRDPVSGWRHNAAFHVIDAYGRLARILPADDPDGALRAADSLARASTRASTRESTRNARVARAR